MTPEQLSQVSGDCLLKYTRVNRLLFQADSRV